VLAFGGTTTTFVLRNSSNYPWAWNFSLFLLAACALPLATIGFPVAVRPTLIAWVVLQIVPTCRLFLARLMRPAQRFFGGVTLSFAPYQTFHTSSSWSRI